MISTVPRRVNPYTVLFLCTGNSARSIMAEAILNHWGKEGFRAFSAGSHPKGRVHPLALETLESNGLRTAGLRSKSWNEFAAAGAPPIDFVFTVCDNAAAEVCPVWPGHPVTAHWGIPDPAAVEGPEDVQRAAFSVAFSELKARIDRMVELPFDELAAEALARRLQEIGKT